MDVFLGGAFYRNTISKSVFIYEVAALSRRFIQLTACWAAQTNATSTRLYMWVNAGRKCWGKGGNTKEKYLFLWISLSIVVLSAISVFPHFLQLCLPFLSQRVYSLLIGRSSFLGIALIWGKNKRKCVRVPPPSDESSLCSSSSSSALPGAPPSPLKVTGSFLHSVSPELKEEWFVFSRVDDTESDTSNVHFYISDFEVWHCTIFLWERNVQMNQNAHSQSKGWAYLGATVNEKCVYFYSFNVKEFWIHNKMNHLFFHYIIFHKRSFSSGCFIDWRWLDKWFLKLPVDFYMENANRDYI